MCLFGVVRLQRPSNEAVKILFFSALVKKVQFQFPMGRLPGVISLVIIWDPNYLSQSLGLPI